MEMRCDAVRFCEQLAKAVVHFRRFERAESKTNPRHSPDESLDELGQRRLRIHAVVTDVDSGQHDLGMVVRESLRLADQRADLARPRGTTSERRRAERAVLIAS